MRVLLFLFVLIPAPVAALDYCRDLWFTRNLAFDRAGYCFGSALGKAVFGNEDCTGTSVTLSPANAAVVDRVRELEAEAGCEVDTSATSLPIPLLPVRLRLTDLPVPTEYESACVGWRAGFLPLYRGRVAGIPNSNTALPGDEILFEFESAGAWEFVQVVRNGQFIAAGWTDMAMDETSCDMWAG